MIYFSIPDSDDLLKTWEPLCDWILESIPSGIILLEGSLGAGKTTLVQVLSRKLGFVGPVLSPTYNLISFYPLINIVHGDLYRIEDPRELSGLGLEDYPQARVFLEWGCQFKDFLEPCKALIHIEYNSLNNCRIADCSLL